MASGKEILELILAKVNALDERMKALSERHDHTNDAMAFMGAAYKRMTDTLTDRVKDHEGRISGLERKIGK